MDREQEVIHKQMEGTRADLTDKLAALESQVSGTVQTATNAVESTKDAVTDTVATVKETVEDVTDKLHNTVESVTETVQDAVEGVKDSVKETFQSVAETFNIRLQTERYPWAVFGGAVAVGCLGGLLLSGPSRRSWSRAEGEWTDRGATPTPPERIQNSDQSGGVSGWLWEQLGGLKGLALGATMGVVRDFVSQALPEELKERVSEEVDKLTKNLGGSPLKGSLFQGNQHEDQAKDNAEDFHNNAGSMNRLEGDREGKGQPVLTKNGR